MQITLSPGKLTGTIQAISSKSQAHRMLICAAVSDKPCQIICADTNEDINATVACLNALGASIVRNSDCFYVEPIRSIPDKAIFDCNESGSTLRFLLPFAGALGVDATFVLRGRLAQRPLSPLWEEMERMGCKLSRPSENTVHCCGRLHPGVYTIDGGVSSQFVTGLLFAMAILPGRSTLNITGCLQSKPYVDITLDVFSSFQVSVNEGSIEGKFPLNGPSCLQVEGDWSNAAFFLVANALGSDIVLENLNSQSYQGDRAIEEILSQWDANRSVDLSQIPDLMPILSIFAAANAGAEFTNIQRLRLKESDRVNAVQSMLERMGIHTESTDSTLRIFPGAFKGGTVNSYNDHRIAMAAAIASTIADGPITITDAQCVKKSYPAFWQDMAKLGGKYEQLEG